MQTSTAERSRIERALRACPFAPGLADVVLCAGGVKNRHPIPRRERRCVHETGGQQPDRRIRRGGARERGGGHVVLCAGGGAGVKNKRVEWCEQ